LVCFPFFGSFVWGRSFVAPFLDVYKIKAERGMEGGKEEGEKSNNLSTPGFSSINHRFIDDKFLVYPQQITTPWDHEESERLWD